MKNLETTEDVQIQNLQSRLFCKRTFQCDTTHDMHRAVFTAQCLFVSWSRLEENLNIQDMQSRLVFKRTFQRDMTRTVQFSLRSVFLFLGHT